MSEPIHTEVEMDLYLYHFLTKEYLGQKMPSPVDPGKSQQTGKTYYYKVGNTTFIKPPDVISDNEVVVFNEEETKWEIKTDNRGASYSLNGNVVTVTKIEESIPEEATDIVNRPPKAFQKPQYVNGAWVDAQLVFHGRNVSTKEDVDSIVTSLIKQLGEEKIKTEKMISLDKNKHDPQWDEFVTARKILLQEADDFITTNNLS